MIITFCGHRNFVENTDAEERLTALIERYAKGNEKIICYNGGYGNFDYFAAKCVHGLQGEYSNICNCLVLPYIDRQFLERIAVFKNRFDETIYLLHRLHFNKCITEEDIDYTIQNLILSILPRPFNYKSKMLLIGGDTSSDFNIFKRFVYWLKQYIKPHQQNFQVIFTLGNHELWEFTNHSLKSIVEKYRILLNKFDMHLLQNNLLFNFIAALV